MEKKWSYSKDYKELFVKEFGMHAGFLPTQLLDKYASPYKNENLKVMSSDAEQEQQWGQIKLLKCQVSDQETFDEYCFPNTCVIDISQGKKITETSIAGRDGCIQEMMGQADYSITINGLLINEGKDEYPHYSVSELLRAFKYKGVDIPVESHYLSLLGIKYICLQKLVLSSKQGYSNVQPFSVEAISRNRFVVDTTGVSKEKTQEKTDKV